MKSIKLPKCINKEVDLEKKRPLGFKLETYVRSCLVYYYVFCYGFQLSCVNEANFTSYILGMKMEMCNHGEKFKKTYVTFAN